MRIQTHRSITLASILVLFIAVTFVPAGSLATAQESGLKGRSITGTVYFVGGRASGRSLTFRLIINRLTTEEEVKRLNVALIEGGQDDLLKTLTHMDAGRIQIGGSVGVVANAIIASPAGDRTKLTVVYERNVHFGELRYGARSQDYRFGYAEMYVGSGANEGMLIPAAKIRIKDGITWEVEDFGTFPARLVGLQVRGGRS